MGLIGIQSVVLNIEGEGGDGVDRYSVSGIEY